MSIKLKGATAGSAVILAAPADTSPTGTEKTFTLPTKDGDAGQILKTDGSGALSFTDNLSSGRNLIINGAMNVAQRGDTANGVTSTGYYSLDRYRFIASAGQYNITRSNDAPVGFSRSWRIGVATSVSLTGTQPLLIQQRIEAQDLQHLNFGTANAVDLTLSFWVKSSMTGTVTVEPFRADGGERQISREVTINAANTWEYKTVSIPGDTVNVIADDNGPGMDVSWWLDAGPDFKSGTVNTSGWAAKVNANRVSSNNIALAATQSANFYLTGVQLEVGNHATPFEHRSYGDELARCQRYYFTLAAGNNDQFAAGTYYNSTLFACTVFFPVTMRVDPVLDYETGTDYYRIWSNGTFDDFAAFGGVRTNINSAGIDTGTGTGGVQGHGGVLTTIHNSAYVAWDSEL